MSGGTGPPHFRSPNIHLFLEPEPSRCWSVLRCGLCHSDLFSSVVTSWPLCLAVACCSYHQPPNPPPPPDMLFHAQATESPAAEQLRIWIDLGWCLHSLEVWPGGYTVQQWLNIVFRGRDNVFYLLNYLFDSSIQAGLLGHGSSVSVDLSGR